MKNAAIVILVSVVAVSTPASAQTIDASVTSWMVHKMVIGHPQEPFDITTAVERMRQIYRPLSQETLSRVDDLNRARAAMIARLLENDLDNDGTVTSTELREILAPQAFEQLISSAGVEIEPTPDQSEMILRQLVAKALVADSNDDGRIDFAEMRYFADEDARNIYGIAPFSLYHKAVVAALDTSDDKAISEAEFIAGTRQIFAIVDEDGDGKISRQEAVLHVRQENTF